MAELQKMDSTSLAMTWAMPPSTVEINAAISNGYGEGQVLVVELLLEVEESGIDCPDLPLCPAQDIAWDDLIAIKHEIPRRSWA